MHLQHKNYVEPEKPEKIIPDVKKDIKDFVDKGKKSYEEIVIEIQKTERMTNDQIIKQIKEVHDEWYPKPEPEEIVEEAVDE